MLETEVKAGRQMKLEGNFSNYRVQFERRGTRNSHCWFIWIEDVDFNRLRQTVIVTRRQMGRLYIRDGQIHLDLDRAETVFFGEEVKQQEVHDHFDGLAQSPWIKALKAHIKARFVHNLLEWVEKLDWLL